MSRWRERRHETTLPRHCERSDAIHLAPPVIASEAKQSILPRKERMDCFAALAVTWRRLAITWSSRHAFATSPRHAPEAFAQSIARAVIASQRVARMRAR